MRPSDRRHLVILAEGEFGPHSGKTAYGVIRYGRDDVIAVIDSTKTGQNVSAYLRGFDIPIVASLDDALACDPPPDALLIGIAPTGGRLPDSWRRIILAAIDAGLDVLSGLHTFIGDDPEFAAAAAARTGAEVYSRQRIDPAGVGFTASPVAANGRIFVVNEDGDTYVIRAGPNYELLAKNSLGEMTMASPAMVGGSLIVRTAAALYRIGK